VWAAKTGVLLDEKTFYAAGHRFHPIPFESAVDIDDDEDLLFAKSVFALKTKA
jgi:CMP-N-acetylneuraminic acid synthetase